MLDEADMPEKDAEDDTMIVFQDKKGQVWELIKRDDFENFDQIIEICTAHLQMIAVFILLSQVPVMSSSRFRTLQREEKQKVCLQN